MIISKPINKAVYFDVDDTLILWNDIEHPSVSVIQLDGICFFTHDAHIEKLKQHYNNGDLIVVWSAGGTQWAERVILALDLQDYVHYILPKPDFYYDDNHMVDWKSSHLYLGLIGDVTTHKYKQNRLKQLLGIDEEQDKGTKYCE